jgi:hypothetical protein
LNYAQAKDPIIIEQWYNFFVMLLKAKKIYMNNIYNFDETGFLIGYRQSENTLSKTPKKRYTIASQSSRISVTAIECMSMTGYLLPPLLILPGKHQMSDWYDSNRDHLPNQYMIKTSDNSYTNDKIAYHWIHHFDSFTKVRTTGPYRLLLMDNHGSHLTADFIQFCIINDILLLLFPPHLTHILQPLDSVPF